MILFASFNKLLVFLLSLQHSMHFHRFVIFSCFISSNFCTHQYTLFWPKPDVWLYHLYLVQFKGCMACTRISPFGVCVYALIGQQFGLLWFFGSFYSYQQYANFQQPRTHVGYFTATGNDSMILSSHHTREPSLGVVGQRRTEWVSSWLALIEHCSPVTTLFIHSDCLSKWGTVFDCLLKERWNASVCS